MQTWQIFSDTGNVFRWETSNRHLAAEEAEDALAQEPSHSDRLPSMADLLLQGSLRLMEGGNGNMESTPIFRTGSGRSLEAKQSSISRVLAILGNEGDQNIQTGYQGDGANRFEFSSDSMQRTGSGKAVKKSVSMLQPGSSGKTHASNSLFQTGSGKKVSISSAGLTRAKTLLGLEENSDMKHFEVFEQEGEHLKSDEPCVFQSPLNWRKGGSNLMLSGDLTNSMFQTGSGKMVNISSAGLVRAKTLWGMEENTDMKHFERFEQEGEHLKSDEPCVSQSSLNGRNSSSKVTLSGVSSTKSIFQTGSGKMVKISSAGLVRAKILLGLEEKIDSKHFEDIEQEGEQQKSEEPCILRSSSLHLDVNKDAANIFVSGDATMPISPLDIEFKTPSREVNNIPDLVQSVARPPPIRFHTAGGRSISVSSDALKRARSLLGDHEVGVHSNEENAIDSVFSSFRGRECNGNSSDKENDSVTPFSHQRMGNGQSFSKNFTSPLRIDLCRNQSFFRLGNMVPGSNLITKFDAEANEGASKAHSGFPLHGNALNKKSCLRKLGPLASKNNLPESSSSGPLLDISNNISENSTDIRLNISEKRRLRSTPSPFKRPRISKFVTPLKKNSSAMPHGRSPLATKQSSQKRTFLLQFPFQVTRLYMKEYIGEAPWQSQSENLPEQIRRMNPDIAEKYTFHNAFGADCIGVETFYHELVESGASEQYISKEWVANHYKWIVWKLASYERCYPVKFSGKLLTTSNVLEELKYRYEREVNHGHRSAIKRILEGDSPPSTPMVLCISSVCSNGDSEANHQLIASSSTVNGATAKIELTDGWYSVYAFLDVLLAKKLDAGKLFVGQKLSIWGAGLCGWVGPISPLEVTRSTNLLLHINGTYRANWADRLGFCKGGSFPLAFRSIKSTGGVVPSTLVGILRIYPVLYRERLPEGGFIVRSERMESKVLQLYNQRRTVVIEGMMSEFQKGNKALHPGDDNDSEEGAKILKILQTAAEPEMLMAEMTSEQLASFTSYQAKLEAMRQSDMQKSLQKAFETAGLSGRDVTPFMRVRVVGLCSKSSPKSRQQTGLITIWSPTEKQQLELVEGQAYVVSRLLPLSSDSSTLYLQTRGSNTTWLPLSPAASGHFEPFFRPRKSILLSNLGEVPFSSEFDVAAFVIYVGDPYTTVHRKKQWVFVTDGSTCDSHSGELLDSLLAISFSAPFCESDLFSPVNPSLAGSVVGFFNLIKRAKDQVNNLWVAEATENSTYSLTFDHTKSNHLKKAADSAKKWANISSLTIENLKKRVLSVISNNEA